MRKIGFFGGTFDPIHFGHIYLAIQLFEKYHLDEVLFCPAFCSPFKSASTPHCTPTYRLEMLRLALEGIPHFRAIPDEIERSGISYTIDTLRALRQEWHGKAALHLLLSNEAAEHLDEWKDFRELIAIAPPLIGTRSLSPLQGSLARELRPGFTSTKAFDVSSTDIRDRLKKGLYCGHLVPAKTLDFIHQKRLYTGRG